MRQRIVGRVDAVVAGAVAGWARRRRGTAPVTVTVLHDGRPIDTVTADRPRPDLEEALAAHGFVFVVPPELDGASGAGLAFVAEDGTTLPVDDGVDLDLALGFDPAFVATLGLDAPFLRGGVDPASDGATVTGFAYSLLRRDPVTVELVAGETVVATAVADGDRPELGPLGRRSSGFTLVPPAVLLDGVPREIAIRVAGTELPGSRRVVAFRPLATEVLRQRAGWIAGMVGPAAGVEAPEAVLIEVDGAVVAATPLAPAAGGRLAFRWRLPPSLCDGAGHHVAVRFGEAGYRIGSAGGHDTLTVRRPIDGHVDGVSGGVLTGVARNAAGPESPVAIEVFDGTRRVAAGHAGRDGSFALPVPIDLFDAPRLLTVTADGETLTPADRPEVAVEISPADQPTGGHRFAGAVTTVSYRGVTGFAVDRATDRPVTVAVTVDGELVATVTAGRLLADLGIEATPPAGSRADCGFHVAFPPQLLNGRGRTVAVMVVGDGLVLPGSEGPVPFPVVWLAEGEAGSAAEPSAATPPRRLRVAFGVTSADPRTPAGDYFTAMELGLALKEAHGCEVVFADLNCRDLAGANVFVVMRHDFPAGAMTGGAAGLVTVAWVRNRTDEWLANGALDRCAVIFASATKAADAIRAATGRPVSLLPIAANTRRFAPTGPAAEHEADIAFTGHFWGDAREAVHQLDPATLKARFAIYGHGWDEDPAFAPYWRGPVPYQELPRVYGSAKLVIDDSHPVTRVWDSLNSRVFDATAAGALVLTNCTGGVAEQFGGRLPSFSTPEELRALVDRYLGDDAAREALATEMRAEVLARHDYRHRAATLVEALAAVRSTLRIAIKSPVPSAAERAAWGDHHFALALKRALERTGAIVRIDDLPDWYGGQTSGDDVVIVLRGLSRYRPSAGALNLLWLISHPDEVSLAELQGYDHVFVASKPYAEKLKPRLGDHVSPLLQATDPELFQPLPAARRPNGPAAGAVVFVGNTRGQRRAMVDRVEAAGHPVRVTGQGWTGIVPDDRIAGTHIENDALSAHYASAAIVINDHWPDMAAEGFLSNRLFDAAAAGATILSDPALSLEEVFGDLVATAATPEEADAAIRRLKADRRRAARAKALRALVVEHHSFDHRAAEILAKIKELHER
ncbi:glycosyltransferase [Pseudoxanthobacter sp. M-2]|uniref:CgeB family protein n=1 Tax=Pseudoxanthobacter sp. M-2 TaxID=3078754 RepID=UPI0038FBF86B